MTGHQPKPEECENCGWETDELTETDCYARGHRTGPMSPDDEKEFAWLCDVCRSTFAGTAFQYPRQYADQAAVLQTIAWGINRILHEIRTAPRHTP